MENGTRWVAKKQRNGLFAWTLFTPARGRKPATTETIVAEIPHSAGTPKEREEIARLIERAPLMREVLLREAESLRTVVAIAQAAPPTLLAWITKLAERLEEAAGGEADA